MKPKRDYAIYTLAASLVFFGVASGSQVQSANAVDFVKQLNDLTTQVAALSSGQKVSDFLNKGTDNRLDNVESRLAALEKALLTLQGKKTKTAD